MKHYDRDTFTYETEGENAVGTSGITFTIGPDGKPTRVLVENLNVRGEGVFKRGSWARHTRRNELARRRARCPSAETGWKPIFRHWQSTACQTGTKHDGKTVAPGGAGFLSSLEIGAW